MSDLLFPRPPTTPSAGHLYRFRVEIFFANGRGNPAGALVGALATAAVLWHYASPLPWIAAWLAVFLAGNTLFVFANSRYREGMALNALHRLLPWRMGAGLLAAAPFGAAPFLLPDGTPPSATILVALILLVLLAMVVMTYYTIPGYFVLVDLVVLGPLMVHLALAGTDVHTLLFVLLLLAQGVLLPKGFQFSRLAIERLRLDVRLAREIRRHTKARRRVRHLALHDPLTGVANRRLFAVFWDRSRRLATREDKQIGLLFVDLDGFKPVNDRLGHAAGDQVLVEVAQRLVDGVRAVDLVSRYGGDEFYVLLEDVASREALAMLADKLRGRIAEPIRAGGETVSVGASIGCALYPADGTTLEELLRVADRRMYEEKARHKARAGAATRR